MNQKLIDFKQKILEEPLSKTDKYWLEQVDFRTNHENELNLFVNSDFVNFTPSTDPSILCVFKNLAFFLSKIFFCDACQNL